jgi:hypothetical protein
MDKFKFGTVTVPDGEKGDWKVSTFTISEADARYHNIFAMRTPGMWVEAGTFKKLTHKSRGVIMSNTPMEVRTNLGAYQAATGRVLINGLGLGMLLEGLLSKPDVTYVRVIEKEQDVIDLVGPHFANDPRVDIVHADALEYKPAKGEVFDYVWHDIWDTICGDNLPQMATLGRRYGKRRAAKQGWWARDMIRADIRSASRW